MDLTTKDTDQGEAEIFDRIDRIYRINRPRIHRKLGPIARAVIGNARREVCFPPFFRPCVLVVHLLGLLGIGLGGSSDMVELSLKGIAGERYRLEQTRVLGGNEWEPIAIHRLSNAVLRMQQPIGSDQQYFRAVLLTE